MSDIILIAHNLRSTHNVGSLLRTAEGLGVNQVYLTGYTPYPVIHNDERLPHQAKKLTAQIHKTALGAEIMLPIKHSERIDGIIAQLKSAGYQICALEQNPDAMALPDLKRTSKLALIVGREAEGIEPEILKQVDKIIEIPMKGQKESFNVVQATAMALYHLVYIAR